MLPIVHIVSGLILAGFLMPFIGLINALLIFIGSVLIDVDHNIYCILYRKELSFKKCYWWHRNDKGRDELHFFHTVELWALLIILSFFNEFILFFSIGLFYHVAFDLLKIYIDGLYGRRAISITAWILRRI